MAPPGLTSPARGAGDVAPRDQVSEFRSLNDAVADYFHREFERLYGAEAIAPEGGYLVPPVLAGEMALKVAKTAGYLAVSNDLLMDCGVIPDTRPRQELSRRDRFRRWRRGKIGSARMAVAARAYRLISGEDVPEPGDDW